MYFLSALPPLAVHKINVIKDKYKCTTSQQVSKPPPTTANNPIEGSQKAQPIPTKHVPFAKGPVPGGPRSCVCAQVPSGEGHCPADFWVNFVKNEKLIEK